MLVFIFARSVFFSVYKRVSILNCFILLVLVKNDNLVWDNVLRPNINLDSFPLLSPNGQLSFLVSTFVDYED